MLPRLIGRSLAKKLIFLGEKLNGLEAKEIGLVDYCGEDSSYINNILQEKLAILSKQGPLAIKAAKKAINQGIENSLDDGLDIEKESYNSLIPSSDRLEGLKSFIDKKRAVYKGK